jgi:hypothetical protein
MATCHAGHTLWHASPTQWQAVRRVQVSSLRVKDYESL